MQFQADNASFDLFSGWLRLRHIAFAEKTQIHWKGLGGFQHPVNMPWSRRTGGGIGPGSRSSATTQHGGDPRHKGFFNLLRTDPVNMTVDTPCGKDHAFAGNDLGTGTQWYGYIRLNVRVSGFANGPDMPIFKPYIRFDNTGNSIDYQGIGNHGISNFN